MTSHTTTSNKIFDHNITSSSSSSQGRTQIRGADCGTTKKGSKYRANLILEIDYIYETDMALPVLWVELEKERANAKKLYINSFKWWSNILQPTTRVIIPISTSLIIIRNN